MEKKNFIIESIKKSDEEKLYVFYNITKNIGIKRMKSLSNSNIQIGEIVKIDGDNYVLDLIFDHQNGQLIINTKQN